MINILNTFSKRLLDVWHETS